MTSQNFVGNIQLFADAAHLILEKQAKRLDDFEIHFFGQSADVVVRFDRGRRSVYRCRLDDIGVDRPLSQPFYIGELHRFAVEYFDEVAADDLALLFGICRSGQIGEKLVSCPDTDNVQSKRFFVLVFAQQSGIYEDTDQLLADGFVKQDGSYR